MLSSVNGPAHTVPVITATPRRQAVPRQTADVLIIGAGVVGCSIAFHLAQQGHHVVALDRGPGAGQGSTSASSAIVRFNYSTWCGVVSAWESKHRWERWEDFLGGRDEGELAQFHRIGGLCLDSPDQRADTVLALFDRADVPYEQWTAQQIRGHFPDMDLGRYYPPKPVQDDNFWTDASATIGGYWTPDSGFVDDPAFAAHNLATAARRHGAAFQFGAQVTAIRRVGGRVTGVDLADGSGIDAPVVVNAAGPHSQTINQLAHVLDDFQVTTRPMRQEVHEIPGGDISLPVVADLDLGTYFRSTPSGNILVGGTEPACDDLQWLDDPDRVYDRPTSEVYRAQSYRFARRVPDVGVPNAPRGIVGVYDVTSDWVPIYDRTSLSGFFVAIGTSGNQFKNAPVIGEILGAIIAAEVSSIDHDSTPVQLTLSDTGHTIDLGQYSRLRTPATTAGNVMG